MDKKFALGIDIGGTNIAWGLVDAAGHCAYEGSLSTQDYVDVESLAEDLCTICSELPHGGIITGIGIGAPAANGKLGAIVHASNLPWKGIVPIRQVFENVFGRNVVLNNDANVCAYGEYMFGAAKAIPNLAVVTLGTGVGAGIIIDGKLLEGFDGNGGEFGHTVLMPEGRVCGCGRRGCLETYTSAKGIVQNATELMHKFPASSIHTMNLETISSKDIAAMASSGDALAIAAFELTGKYLGWGIANLVTVLGLERVLLFGGPVRAGDVLMQSTRAAYQAQVIHYYKDTVNIDYAGLQGGNAAVVGAAAMAF